MKITTTTVNHTAIDVKADSFYTNTFSDRAFLTVIDKNEEDSSLTKVGISFSREDLIRLKELINEELV